MNSAIIFLCLVFLAIGVVYVVISARRVTASSNFMEELNRAVDEDEIYLNDYLEISKLFIINDGFSYTLQAHLEKLLREAKERKTNGV